MGDSGVLSLIVLISAMYFAYCRSGRAGLALLLSFGIAVFGTTIAKLLFLGCMPGSDVQIHSPSGHTALSAAVYGMLAIIFASQFRKPARLLTYIAFFGLIAVIAYSREALGFHSANEVIAGLLIGGVSVLIAYFYLYHRRNAVPPFNPYFLILLLGTMAYFLHGTRLPAEAFIKEIAVQIKTYIPACD